MFPTTPTPTARDDLRALVVEKIGGVTHYGERLYRHHCEALADAVMELFESVTPSPTYIDEDGVEWSASVSNAVRFVLRTVPTAAKRPGEAGSQNAPDLGEVS